MAGIRIELRKTTKRWTLRRPQRWYFRVIAANGRVLTTSEM